MGVERQMSPRALGRMMRMRFGLLVECTDED